MLDNMGTRRKLAHRKSFDRQHRKFKAIKDLIADNSKEIELSFGPRIARSLGSLRH